MSAPYREPSKPREESPITLTHDYAADVRRQRDPKRLIKGTAVATLLWVAWRILKFALFGRNGDLGWYAIWSGVILLFFLMVFLPLCAMKARADDEKMHVSDVLDDLERRERR
jgi:hypothetical protein